MRVADAGTPQSEPRPATIRESLPANHNLDRSRWRLLAGRAVGLLGYRKQTLAIAASLFNRLPASRSDPEAKDFDRLGAGLHGLAFCSSAADLLNVAKRGAERASDGSSYFEQPGNGVSQV
jgi:hypothetical protein